MSSNLYKTTLCVLTALGLGFAVPAGAQDTTEPAPKTASAPPDDSVDEIIVTARRVEERLQDVPISITVFNQEQLTERNVTTGKDLAIYTPSLSANSRFGTDNTSFAIRGFTQEARTTASVGTYFADVIAPRAGASVPGGDGAGPGAFFDLANVQVLKGPQGTLFGRNTTGGAVLLVPQKPTFNYEGFVENTLGNYYLQHTTAVVNVPLSDSLRFRAGIDRTQRDGYLKNVSGIGPNDFGDIGYNAGRASLVADLAPNLENYTIGSYSLSETNGTIPKIFACNPQSRTPFAPLGCDQIAREADQGDYAVSNDDPDAHTRTEQWQVINTTTWTTSDTLTIKNIASYAQLVNDLEVDVYGAALVTPASYGTDAANRPQDAGVLLYGISAIPAPGRHSIDQSTLTEELQFQGAVADGRLNWQGGFYFESSEAMHPNGTQAPSVIQCDDSASLDCYDIIGRHVRPDLPAGSVNVGSLGHQVGTIDFRNYGLYTQSTFALTEQLKATAGVRYTNDTMEGDAIMGRWIFGGADASTPMFYCSNPDSGQPTGPRNADGSQNAPVASPDLCRVHYKKKTDAPTWVVGLDYKPTDDVLLYGKYSRGYRQGGVSPYAAKGYTTWDAEKVDTYEIGTKTSFHAPIRGSFNLAAFYNDFTDQQLQIGFAELPGNTVPGNAGIANAGSSRIYGAEVETVLIPVRGLNLSISYAYLSTRIESIELVAPSAPYNTAIPSAAAGDPLPYTPKNKASATATYTLPLDASIGEVSIGSTYTYQSEFLVTKNSPYGTVDAYDLINLNLNWSRIAGGPVDAGLFVTNVADDKYMTAVAGGYNNFGFEPGFLAEPRMYGARVRVNFGS